MDDIDRRLADPDDLAARHAFRPWRGLGEVVLPLSASEGWRRHVRAQWGPVLDPATRVSFAPPLPEDE